MMQLKRQAASGGGSSIESAMVRFVHRTTLTVHTLYLVYISYLIQYPIYLILSLNPIQFTVRINVLEGNR